MSIQVEFDLLIHDAQVYITHPQGQLELLPDADIAIKDGKIAEIGKISKNRAQRTASAKGLTALPGVIDSQVHFREPGLTHKEDFASGTYSAVLGGITSVFEMPNTKPPTLNALDLSDKCTRAQGRAWCNMAFYMGASASNIDRLPELENLPGCVGIKVFFGSSTGNLLFNKLPLIEQLMLNTKKPIAFHCEDEELLVANKHLIEGDNVPVSQHEKWRSAEVALSATKKVLELAVKTKRKVHILHVTTAEEMELLAKHKANASVEVTPQHLFLTAPDCYERLGTLAQMNPPIRDKRHQDALWKALNDGVVDVIGSDHAPHTALEKAATYPNTPSGMPGVQTLLPLLLKFHKEGRLSMERLIQLVCRKPAELFHLPNKGHIRPGNDADLTFVDMNRAFTITNGWSRSRAGWTPFDGVKIPCTPTMTVVAGEIVMRDNEVLGKPLGQLLFA